MLRDKIAMAEFGFDEAIKAGIFEFLSKAANVDGKGVLVHKGVGLPECFHELFPADNLALVLHEH